jgi:hypothetical protein
MRSLLVAATLSFVGSCGGDIATPDANRVLEYQVTLSSIPASATRIRVLGEDYNVDAGLFRLTELYASYDEAVASGAIVFDLFDDMGAPLFSGTLSPGFCARLCTHNAGPCFSGETIEFEGVGVMALMPFTDSNIGCYNCRLRGGGGAGGCW